MKTHVLALLLILAVSCGTPTGPGVKDGMLAGYWHTGRDYVEADQYNVFVGTTAASGATGGPVFMQTGRKFDAVARVRLQPDSAQPIEGTPVRLVGHVDPHTGKLLISIVDAAGRRHYTRWLDVWRPSGPPPSAPPVLTP